MVYERVSLSAATRSFLSLTSWGMPEAAWAQRERPSWPLSVGLDREIRILSRRPRRFARAAQDACGDSILVKLGTPEVSVTMHSLVEQRQVNLSCRGRIYYNE